MQGDEGLLPGSGNRKEGKDSRTLRRTVLSLSISRPEKSALSGHERGDPGQSVQLFSGTRVSWRWRRRTRPVAARVVLGWSVPQKVGVWGCCFYRHCTGGRTKAQRGSVTYPRLHSWASGYEPTFLTLSCLALGENCDLFPQRACVSWERIQAVTKS